MHTIHHLKALATRNSMTTILIFIQRYACFWEFPWISIFELKQRNTPHTTVLYPFRELLTSLAVLFRHGQPRKKSRMHLSYLIDPMNFTQKNARKSDKIALNQSFWPIIFVICKIGYLSIKLNVWQLFSDWSKNKLFIEKYHRVSVMSVLQNRLWKQNSNYDATS